MPTSSIDVATLTELRGLAARVAREALSALPDEPWRWIGFVQLEKLVSRWQVKQAYRVLADYPPNERWKYRSTEGLSCRTASEAEGRREIRADEAGSPQIPLPLEPPRYEIGVFSEGMRARFTFAHEVSHVVLDAAFRKEAEALSEGMREWVCNLAAGLVVLPDTLLLSVLPRTDDLSLSIPLLEGIAARSRVSLSVLISRMNDLVRCGLVRVMNGAVIVRLAWSRKQQENLAPRISSSCLPGRWFLPVNRRLSSVGLVALARVFDSVPLYLEGGLEDEITVRDQELRRPVHVKCNVRYKCYTWSAQDNSGGFATTGANQKLMLAVISMK